MSVYTELLKILAEYSERVDAAEVGHDDFIEFQKLQPRIIKAYQTGYFKHREYTTLNNIYYYVKEGFRIDLGLEGR